MHDLERLLQMINPEIHARLRRAVEIGRWEDGTRLRPDQIEHCLQAIIAWEQKHLPPEQRVGHMEDACRSKQSDVGPSGDAEILQRLSMIEPSATRH